MKISQQATQPSILVLPYGKDKVDYKTIQNISGIHQDVSFKGDFKEVKILYHPTEKRKVYLLGLGEQKLQAKSYVAFRHLAHNHHKDWPDGISVESNHLDEKTIEQAIIGLKLATYQIGRYKEEKNERPAYFSEDYPVGLTSDKHADAIIKSGLATAESMIEIMTLVNAPPNEKTPQHLANWAKASASKYGYKMDILDKGQLESEGLHALLAVGQGSKYPPVLIKMEYKPEGSGSKAPKIGLVGKGITFDTGGLSIKGSQNLHYMKSDMGGAAAVLGAMELAAKLKLDIHVVGIVASAENAVDANSYRPGDVIRSYSGKTIEVIDTDAEGRLILADALAYMQHNYAPEYLIDLATLTGNSVQALGYAAGALFTKDDKLAQMISSCGSEVDERMWRLPLYDDFEADLESDIADVRNYSGKPLAGAITAAKFLEYFMKDYTKWAHLDIAGVAFGDSEFSKMKSAQGFGPRLLIELMRRLESF